MKVADPPMVGGRTVPRQSCALWPSDYERFSLGYVSLMPLLRLRIRWKEKDLAASRTRGMVQSREARRREGKLDR